MSKEVTCFQAIRAWTRTGLQISNLASYPLALSHQPAIMEGTEIQSVKVTGKLEVCTKKPGTEVRPQSIDHMPKRVSDDSIAFTLSVCRRHVLNSTKVTFGKTQGPCSAAKSRWRLRKPCRNTTSGLVPPSWKQYCFSRSMVRQESQSVGISRCRRL